MQTVQYQPDGWWLKDCSGDILAFHNNEEQPFWSPCREVNNLISPPVFRRGLLPHEMSLVCGFVYADLSITFSSGDSSLPRIRQYKCMWFTMNSVGSQHLDLQNFKLLLNTENDVPQLLKCFVWDTQKKFSDYWVIIAELLQLLFVLTFHCNEVIFKLPARMVLQDLLKSKNTKTSSKFCHSSDGFCK